MFDEAEQAVGGEGQDRGRQRAGEDESVVDRRHSAKDEFAEAACTDGRSDRRDADADDRSGANSSEDVTRGQGQTHDRQALPPTEAQSLGGVEQVWVDAAQSCVGIAQDGQQRVAGQRDDGDAGRLLAEPRQRQKDAKQRQARDGLNDIGKANEPARGLWAFSRIDAKRHGDDDRDQHGDAGHP